MITPKPQGIVQGVPKAVLVRLYVIHTFQMILANK